MATVKANTTLVIQPKSGATYDLTFGGVTQYGRTSGDTIGVFPVDKEYTLVKHGKVEVYAIDQFGVKSYEASDLPDPDTIGVGSAIKSDNALNLVSGGEFVPVRAEANSLAVVGDSFMANGYFKSATAEEWNARGYLTHAIALSNGRMYLVDGGMCAVGGSGITADINGVKFDTQLTSAIATGAKNLLVMGGVNDCNSDVDPLVTFAAYKALVNRAVAAGMKVWVATQPCQSSTFVAYTVARQGAQLKLQDLMRQWCRTQSPNNVVLIDSAQACIDPASTTASYISGYTTDNLHPNNKGAYYIGKYIAGVWNKYVPQGSELVNSNADNTSFSALSNNLLTNGLMIANTGGLATGFTTPVTGTAVVGIVAVTARADGVGNDQVVPLTFSAANDSGQVSTATLSNFVDGDQLYAECEVTVSSPVAVRGVKLFMQIAGNLVSRTATTNQIDNTLDVAIGEAVTYVMRTPIIKYDAAAQGATHTVQAIVIASASGAGSCTLKVGRFSIKKVL